MVAATEERVGPEVQAPRRTFYPQVHALRAIAVSMVLLYHLWPERYTGGFIGVDVFLVISGFLITGHIWRQREQSWRMLPTFWARRVLRLGPSALTVVVATAVITAIWVPQALWERFAREGIASVLIGVNFVLYGDAVDYLAAENSPTPFQHYWSLSVEEQFYLVWPILLIIAALVAARFLPRRRAWVSAVVLIALVSVASFVVSLVVLPVSPSAAYFLMPLRMWEFGFGAILALVLPLLTQKVPSAGVRAAALVLLPISYLALIANGYVLDGSVPFPGWNALLPVALTTAVIFVHPFAGVRPGSAIATIESGPITKFMGDVSYAAYLWHWPLIILLPYVIGASLTAPTKVAILVVTFVLAWLTTRFIETPLRTIPKWSWRAARPRLLAMTAWAAVAIAAWSLMLGVGAASLAQGAFTEEEQATPCFGAAALMNAEACGDVHGEMPSADVIAAASEDLPDPWSERDCVAPYNGPESPHCEYLVADEGAPAILLWGDSHAGAWAPAFEEAAKELDLNLYVFSRDGCPPSDISPVKTVYADRLMPEDERTNCRERNAEVEQFVANHPEIEAVFLANFSTNYVFPLDAEYGDVDVLFTRLLEGDATVVRMGDAPLMKWDNDTLMNIPTCLEVAGKNTSFCDAPRDRTFPAGGQLDFVLEHTDESLRTIDTSSASCDDETCYGLIGGVPLFFDGSHLSETFSRSLGPWMTEQLTALGIAGA